MAARTVAFEVVFVALFARAPYPASQSFGSLGLGGIGGGRAKRVRAASRDGGRRGRSA